MPATSHLGGQKGLAMIHRTLQDQALVDRIAEKTPNCRLSQKSCTPVAGAEATKRAEGVVGKQSVHYISFRSMNASLCRVKSNVKCEARASAALLTLFTSLWLRAKDA